MNEDAVAALTQIIVIGSEGNTDFVGFDLRTVESESGEASFVLHLMDDSEIEYLAENAGSGEPTGFDVFVEGHARRFS